MTNRRDKIFFCVWYHKFFFMNHQLISSGKILVAILTMEYFVIHVYLGMASQIFSLFKDFLTRGTFKNDIWIRMHGLLMIRKLSSICKFIFTCWTFMNLTLIGVNPKMLIEIWFIFYRFATGFTGKHVSLLTNQNWLKKVLTNLGMCDNMTPD